MDKVTISQRKLSPAEVVEIVDNIKQFPDLAFVSPRHLSKLSEVYVAECDGEFAGICAIETYKGLRKLGPIAVAVRFQKQGVGGALLRKVVEVSKGMRTYFGTSHQKIREYGLSIGAKEYRYLWQAPADIRSAVLHFFVEYLSARYLFEALRKLFTYGRHRYTYFLLP